MDIRQGDIYWLHITKSRESQGTVPHPYVVIQDDVINRSRVETIVVCALTSNLNRANEPGNILLDAGEANLPRQSVVVVSQIETVKKTEFGECIGSLRPERIAQIFKGLAFQQASFFRRYHLR
jgi:mRNA interferase MazF